MTDTPRVHADAPPQPGLRPALSAIDIVAVLVGVLAFASLALWGFTAWEFPWNLVYGIGAPVVAILVWALFVSPRAVLAVHPFVRAVVELLVYLAATIAWWSMGQPWIGLGYAVVAVTFGLLAGRRRLA